ncbi:MAG: FKBP-type peptidyl-prolyl cis-trans isomerase [Clostridia bacterium]|nr:FKBP-type peptidyl-prolyl cis-trans isomerase [Clostridia bacterium]
MKKIFAIMLCAVMALSLISCGKESFSYMEEDLSQYVTVGEFKNLDVTYPAVAAVTDAQVKDHAASHLGHSEEKPETVDGAVAADGNLVNIDYKGTLDGVEFEGGTAEETDLLLGSGAMIDGFEDGIVGMTVGETKVIDVTFPEDYGNAELAGKAAKFEITLNAVYADSVFDAVRAELEGSREKQIENTKKQYAWTAIVEGATVIGYPEAAVQKLANDLYGYYQALYYSYTQYGLTLENLGITEESCLEEAKGTFKEEMVLYSIAKANGYTVTDEEYEAKVASLAETQQISASEYKKHYSRQSVETKVLYEEIMADVVATSTFTEK